MERVFVVRVPRILKKNCLAPHQQNLDPPLNGVTDFVQPGDYFKMFSSRRKTFFFNVNS
jgi:hypothetical protein